jgi:hypothetical protein
MKRKDTAVVRAGLETLPAIIRAEGQPAWKIDG